MRTSSTPAAAIAFRQFSRPSPANATTMNAAAAAHGTMSGRPVSNQPSAQVPQTPVHR